MFIFNQLKQQFAAENDTTIQLVHYVTLSAQLGFCMFLFTNIFSSTPSPDVNI